MPGRPRGAARRLAIALLAGFLAPAALALDIDSAWNFRDPLASEARFRAMLAGAGRDERLELLTQIARTHSLRRDFAAAHALLDEVEGGLADAGPAPRVRYLLERGRCFNSDLQPGRARPLFEQAWQAARAAGLEGLAVDAAHMVAITWRGRAEAIDWNRQALAQARGSDDAKARALIPALLNNLAWDLHDQGRCEEALPLFRESLDVRRALGRPGPIRFAEYAVGRCLRLLGRSPEAQAIQRRLEGEYAAAGETNGYVFEEIAELLAAEGRDEEARPYFRRAADELGKDPWLAKNEPQRIERLRARGR